MENVYELIVENESTGKNRVKVVLVWAGCIIACFVLFVLGAIFQAFPVALIGAAMFISLALLYQKRSHAEFEYIFTDGHMTVDKIVKRVRRVSLTEINFAEVQDFGVYKKNVKSKYKPYFTYNHTIHANRKQWYCYFYSGKKKCLLIFEPDEKLLALIKQALPTTISNYAFVGN